MDGTSTVPGTPDGSIAHPFLTIQAALDDIGPAVDFDDFNDAFNRSWKVVVEPGQYIEDLSIPIRADWTFEVNGVVIVGDVLMTYVWSDYNTQPATGLTQVKVKFVGGDLRGAFQVQGPSPPQIMAINGISGNLIFRPTSNQGLSTFIQCNLINFGVTGTPGGTPGSGTGNVIADGTVTYALQLFMSNAILTGDFYMTPGSILPIQGTLYASNTDTSSTASNGGTFGAVILNVLRNVRFTRPVVASGVHSRWTNVEFAAVANDFTGSTGTALVDYNSFRSYFVNVPVKGANLFQIIDNLQGSTANRPTAILTATTNNGVMYWDTTLVRPIWRNTASASGWSFADGTVA